MVERLVFRPLVGQSPLTLFMATIGISFFIEGLVEAVWGGNPHMLKIGLPESSLFTIDYAWAAALGLDIIVQESDLLAVGVGLVLVLGLFVFFHYSRIGQALRAVADDHTASLSVGIPLDRMWVIVWSLAGLTAFVAATVWGTKIQIEPTMIGLALKALPVLILGGLTSIPGALVGGCIIGVSELLFETYWGQPLLGGATTEWFAFMLALVFLRVPAAGPVRRADHRAGVGSGSERCCIARPASSRPATARTRRSSGSRSTATRSPSGCSLAFVLVPLTASNYVLTDLLTPFLIMSIAALGLNVLTGYCGQL